MALDPTLWLKRLADQPMNMAGRKKREAVTYGQSYNQTAQMSQQSHIFQGGWRTNTSYPATTPSVNTVHRYTF